CSVRRCGSNFFITLKYSRRFIWKHQLTHQEVGMNLDYDAAGHVDVERSEKRSFSWIVESSGPSHIPIHYQNVFQSYMKSYSQFASHCRKKVELFNETVSLLGLPYRFD